LLCLLHASVCVQKRINNNDEKYDDNKNFVRMLIEF